MSFDGDMSSCVTRPGVTDRAAWSESIVAHLLHIRCSAASGRYVKRRVSQDESPSAPLPGSVSDTICICGSGSVSGSLQWRVVLCCKILAISLVDIKIGCATVASWGIGAVHNLARALGPWYTVVFLGVVL